MQYFTDIRNKLVAEQYLLELRFKTVDDLIKDEGLVDYVSHYVGSGEGMATGLSVSGQNN